MKQSLISKVMAEMGRLGGKAGGHKGGRSRMAALSPEERKVLARKAALARWRKRKEQQKETVSQTQNMESETAIPALSLTTEQAGDSNMAGPKPASIVATIASSIPISPEGPLPTPPQESNPESAASHSAFPPGYTSSPPPPVEPDYSPSLSVNLLAARVNAGKHYEGVDWAADPLPAKPIEDNSRVENPQAEATRHHIAHALGDLAAQLDAGLSDGAQTLLRQIIATIGPMLDPGSPQTAVLHPDKLRETLFLLDEVRLTLTDDSGIGARSARRALKLWTDSPA